MENKEEKRICFLYTETTGLHNTYENVSKKKLYAFARLVKLNYEIGYFKDNEFYQEKVVKEIVKPRCMVIPKETEVYHGISQELAEKKGICPEILIEKFKNDINSYKVEIIVSHNADFHIKTVLAEAIRYNIQLEFANHIIIDTISFNHDYGYIKLLDLADKLKIKNKDEKDKLELIKIAFFKLYIKFEKSIKS